MDLLFGIHPVEEALRSGTRRFDHICVARERDDRRAEPRDVGREASQGDDRGALDRNLVGGAVELSQHELRRGDLHDLPVVEHERVLLALDRHVDLGV